MKNKALIGLFLLIIIFLLILIIYKNRFRNEAFMNSPGPYDNGKVYTLGDVVIHDDIIYIMKDGIGAAGYAPPRPNNWAPLPSANLCTPVEYDNGKVYKVGDLVSKDAVIYVMIDGIGAAGYAPPRPTNWTPVSLDSIKTLCVAAAPAPVVPGKSVVAYDNSKVYKLGDIVIHDEIIYIMKDGIGAAGYAPPRPNNWAPLPPVNLCTPVEYDNGKVYKVGDLVSKDAVIYVMIDGIGAAGYSPPRPTNWTPVSLDSIAAFCPVPAPPSVPMQAPPAVMQAPARMKAGPARMKAAPVKSRFSAIGRIVKKEGFFDISNSLRSKMTKSLLFGPADFSSI